MGHSLTLDQDIHFTLLWNFIVAGFIKATAGFFKVLGSHATEALNDIHVGKHFNLIIVKCRVTIEGIVKEIKVTFRFHSEGGVCFSSSCL